MTMTQRYAGMLQRHSHEWDRQSMPVKAEATRQAARHMEELQAKLDAAMTDAARYRWLRNEAWGGSYQRGTTPHVVLYRAGLAPSAVLELAEQALDDAIDAEVSGHGKEGA